MLQDRVPAAQGRAPSTRLWRTVVTSLLSAAFGSREHSRACHVGPPSAEPWSSNRSSSAASRARLAQPAEIFELWDRSSYERIRATPLRPHDGAVPVSPAIEFAPLLLHGQPS